MRRTWAALALFLSVTSTSCGADPTPSTATSASRFSRETPTVLAVRKVRDGIVTLRVQKKSARKETVGSGVVIDERGYIVTNRHVVTGGLSLKVVLSDDTVHAAEMEFEDAAHDLAVVKITTGRKLRALPLGPASDLMVGEQVIAIGHPYGYVNSVSTGIVGFIGREVEMPGGVVLKNLIQVTAAINPGNSGGPLLNINGEVIGINVALRPDAQGIAFALNADEVQQVLSRRLSASRKLGLYHGLDVREKVLADGDRSLVLVHEVSEGTPAASAGLKEGDRVVRVGKCVITNRFDVERSLWDAHTGETVAVTVVRAGKNVELPMKLSCKDSHYETASRR